MRVPSLVSVNAQIAHHQSLLGNLRDELVAADKAVSDAQVLLAAGEASDSDISKLRDRAQGLRDRICGLEALIVQKQAIAAELYAQQRAHQAEARRREFESFLEQHAANLEAAKSSFRELCIALARFGESTQALFGRWSDLGGAHIAERTCDDLLALQGQLQFLNGWKQSPGLRLTAIPARPAEEK